MKLLTAKEVAVRFGIPQSTVYALAKQGAIPHVVYGQRAVRFPEAEIEKWLEGRIRRPDAA